MLWLPRPDWPDPISASTPSLGPEELFWLGREPRRGGLGGAIHCNGSNACAPITEHADHRRVAPSGGSALPSGSAVREELLLPAVKSVPLPGCD